MKKTLAWLAAIGAGALLSSCGEVPLKRPLPDNIQKVFIQAFENKTQQPDIERTLTEKVSRALIGDGRLSVTSEEQADAILKADVQRYDRIPLTYDANHVPQQYKLQVAVDVDLVEKATGKVLLSTRPVSDAVSGTASALDTNYDSTNTRSLKEFTNYFVINSVGMPPEDEATAQNRLLDAMANRILRFVTEGF